MSSNPFPMIKKVITSFTKVKWIALIDLKARLCLHWYNYSVYRLWEEFLECVLLIDDYYWITQYSDSLKTVKEVDFLVISASSVWDACSCRGSSCSILSRGHLWSKCEPFINTHLLASTCLSNQERNLCCVLITTKLYINSDFWKASSSNSPSGSFMRYFGDWYGYYSWGWERWKCSLSLKLCYWLRKHS